jgi:hypothetical protein
MAIMILWKVIKSSVILRTKIKLGIIISPSFEIVNVMLKIEE